MVFYYSKCNLNSKMGKKWLPKILKGKKRCINKQLRQRCPAGMNRNICSPPPKYKRITTSKVSLATVSRVKKNERKSCEERNKRMK